MPTSTPGSHRPCQAKQANSCAHHFRRLPNLRNPLTSPDTRTGPLKCPPTAEPGFEAAYAPKWPKAAAKITDETDVLLAFFDYPAEHWVHLRTTNPIESTFATVRLRQRVTKGPGSRAAGIAMAFKLLVSAQHRWRSIRAPHLAAQVRAGATFKNGKLVEPETNQTTQQQVA